MSANGKNAKPQGKQPSPSTKRTASASAGNSGAKSPRSRSATARAKVPTADERRRREIAGIALIALGLFLALTHFGPTGIIGEKVSGFTFGLTGVFAYV